MINFIAPGKAGLSGLLVAALYIQIKYPNLAIGHELNFVISLLWLWVV